MLRSIRLVFEMIGIKPESMKFIKEQINADNLVNALAKKPKKCPAIVTCNLFGDKSPHIMVAANALKGQEFIDKNDPRAEALCDEWFINCKNSYRDEIEEPGNFCEGQSVVLIIFIFVSQNNSQIFERYCKDSTQNFASSIVF